jgi:hypothetical protein
LLIDLHVVDVVVIVLQREIPFLYNFDFFVLVERVELLVEVGELVIANDRLHSDLSDIVGNVGIDILIAFEEGFDVVLEIQTVCVSVAQIDDDLV